MSTMNKEDLKHAWILDTYYDDNLKEQTNPLVLEAIKHFEEKQKRNMGIGMMMSSYIFTHPNQETWAEYAKIKNAIDEYIKLYAKKHNKQPQDYNLQFINYGRTELVYVLSDETSGDKITILAKQPVVEFGKVKQEAKNLIELNKVDKNVIAPIDYFASNEQELYVTPYINQARCIGSQDNWGMYVPEPRYRFVPFSKMQEKLVNMCMIAKLVSYYDEKNQEGISACKLGGGDFMLPKGWENKTSNVEETLNSLMIIAVREKIKCPLDEYLDIIRKEFSIKTIDLPQDRLKINHRGRVAMEKSDIERGIRLGKMLLRTRNNELINN